MTRPIVTDHALLRFLERAGGLDVEGVRHAIADALARAHGAARAIGADNYQIRAEGFVWIVHGEKLITVHEERAPAKAQRR